MARERSPRTGSREMDLALEKVWDKLQAVENAQKELKVERVAKDKHQISVKTSDGRATAVVQVDDGETSRKLDEDIDGRGHKIRNIKSIEADEIKASKGTVTLGRDVRVKGDGERAILNTPYFDGHIMQGPMWSSVWVPAEGFNLNGSNQPTYAQITDNGSGSVGVFGYQFAQSDEVFFTVRMPNAIQEDTSLFPHVNWSPETSNTNNVVFKLEYCWANSGENFGTTTSIQIADTPSGSALDYQVVDITNGDGIEPSASQGGIGSILLCRLSRGVTIEGDTYTGTPFILGVDFHVIIDSAGSRQEYIK